MLRGRADRWMIAGALAFAALVCLPMLVYPMGPDQAYYAVGGRIVAEGGVPSVDYWGQAPPGGLYLHAIAERIFGRSELAIRWLDWLWSMATALSLALLVRRLCGPVAGLAAAGFWVWSYAARYSFWHSAQVDGWLTLPAIGVLALAHQGCRDRRTRFWLGAGVLLSVAFVIKYVALVLLLPVTLVVWSGREPGAVGLSVVRPLIGVAAGFALGLAPWVGWVAATGALASMLADASGANLGYSAVSPFSGGLEDPLRILSHLGGQHLALLLLGALGLATIGRLQPVARALAVGWLVAAALSFTVQLKGFIYHSLPLLGPLALLAASGLHAVWPKLPRFAAVALVSVGLVSQAPALAGWLMKLSNVASVATTAKTAEDVWRGWPGSAERWAVVDRIRANTDADDTIFVWGYEPLIHFETDRRSPTRFLTNAPLIAPWGQPAWRREVLSDLSEHPPAYIVVCHGDAIPWVTGLGLDSAALLSRFPELKALIERDYRRIWRKRRFTLYRRAAPG